MKSAEMINERLIEASRILPEDAMHSIMSAIPSGGKAESVMNAIKKNIDIAEVRQMPLCQDTGAFWCLASIGRDSSASIGDIEKIVNEGAATAAEEGYFRKSIVSDPVLGRVNTKTNLPVFINYEVVEGKDVSVGK